MDWFLTAEDTTHKLALMSVALVLFVVVVSVCLYGLERLSRLPGWVVATLLVTPSLVLLGVGLIYPAFGTLVDSFHDRSGRAFVGFDNYRTIFTDDALLLVLRNTLLWVLLVPVAATSFGLVYAYLVDQIKLETLAKTLVFLPMSISFVGASIIWRFVYEYRPRQDGVEQIGLANQILVWLGAEPRQFLLDQPTNNLAMIFVLIWIQAGFAMTVLSAAIKAIPEEIVEAARLDGVSGLRMLRHVTIPSIRPTLVVVVTTIAIGTLKVFDIVRTMTGGNYGTSVIANEFYTQAFRQANGGLGSALAVVLFVMVIPVIAYNIRQLRLSEDVR